MFYTDHILQTTDQLIPLDGYWQHIFSVAVLKFNHIHDIVLQEFGPHGVVVLSLFAIFLLLIIIIYAKTLIDTFKYGKAEEEHPESEPNGLYYTLDEEPSGSANDNSPEEPLYDEEEKERIQQERALSAELIRISQQTTEQVSLDAIKQTMKNDSLKEKERLQKVSSRQRTKTSETPDVIPGKVEHLLALILTLLSRGVTEAKTIQAIYFYYKSMFDEEDVFQMVRSIRDFIGLCNAGKFDDLPNISELPTPEDALLDLGKGNFASCLILLQALLNNQMDRADRETGNLQDLNYAIAANYACLMGNIARLNDIELAHNSFELATELSPKSVTAWNRLGDIYMLENAPQKAFIAFQNVLDIGDPTVYAPQVADAQKYLADYFENSGLVEKAAEIRRLSDRFYEIYGLRTPLSPLECNVLQTLLNNSTENLASGIAALLNHTR